MSPFSRSETDEIIVWLGEPNCQAAHSAIAAWIREHCSSLHQEPPELNTRLQGNLGETIAYCVGKWNDYNVHLPFPANAWDPLFTQSRPEVDIVWIHFGEIPSEDALVIQEVKTTVQNSLDLTADLVVDYRKLFGSHPRLSLHSRLQGIKNQIEDHHGLELAKRVSHLAGKSAATSPRVSLIPTLVHERGAGDPTTKLLAVRTTLVSEGWSGEAIVPWSISLSDLAQRLVRLAMGSD